MLDNPWFTVNQRGVTSWNGGLGLDRWKISPSGHMTCNIVSGGITLAYDGNATYTEFQQLIENEIAKSLDGKMVTLSAIINGQLYQGSAIYNYSENTNPIAVDIDGGKYKLNLRNIPNNAHPMIARFISNASESFTSQTITAIKLEKGSISTLAMDTAPNYATELLKCQRYYHIYATESLRPSNMYDCVPVMASTPSQGTITIDDTTYYYNSTDL